MDSAGHQIVVNAAAFTELPDYQLTSKPGQLSRDQLRQFYDDVSRHRIQPSITTLVTPLLQAIHVVLTLCLTTPIAKVVWRHDPCEML